ncbi:trypsin domain-containing protein [Ditylenchus destructor]|nr:trypsin domain-containing protein [Ditylenchus destructor]
MATVQFLCVCAVFITVSTAALSVTNDDDQCGVSDYQPSQLETKLIRNGAVVPQGKYPWLAYLGSVSWVVGCTSTIVSRKYILTAGHCVCQQRPDGSPPLPCKLEDHTKMSVVVGSVNKLEGKKLKIRRLIPHEKYLAVLPGGGVTYDVGLIELEEELSYSKDVRRICLSAKNQEALKNKIVTTAGWGDIYGNSTFPARLREGTERVVSDAKCQKM